MTIDERLERLTERHEALTQTVELIAAAQIKNDERMAELRDTMNRLANIIIAHEQRIEHLEDRQQ
jgi:non-ribosomal peptide synthetase component F